MTITKWHFNQRTLTKTKLKFHFRINTGQKGLGKMTNLGRKKSPEHSSETTSK